MENAKLQESLKSAIGKHAYKFTDLHGEFHKRSIGCMGRITQIMMDHSIYHVFKSDKQIVWMMAIDFFPGEVDIKNLEKYAIAIFEMAGINWVRIVYEDCSWDMKITINSESITSKSGD